MYPKGKLDLSKITTGKRVLKIEFYYSETISIYSINLNFSWMMRNIQRNTTLAVQGFFFILLTTEV